MALNLTRRIDYALIALYALVRESRGRGNALSARQIALRHQLPLPLLMNLLKDLQKAGLLVSRRGATGGYALSGKPQDITLLTVVQAVEGPFQLADCCVQPHVRGARKPEPDGCRVGEGCPTRAPLKRLNDRFAAFLQDVTLDELFAATDGADPA